MQHLVFLLANKTTAPLLTNLVCLINHDEGKSMLLAFRLLAIRNVPRWLLVKLFIDSQRAMQSVKLAIYSNLFPHIQLGLQRVAPRDTCIAYRLFLRNNRMTASLCPSAPDLASNGRISVQYTQHTSSLTPIPLGLLRPI
jgi:hypothetical protein